MILCPFFAWQHCLRVASADALGVNETQTNEELKTFLEGSQAATNLLRIADDRFPTTHPVQVWDSGILCTKSMTYIHWANEMQRQSVDGIEVIDRPMLLSAVQFYQFCFLPRRLWLFTVCEIASHRVEYIKHKLKVAESPKLTGGYYYPYLLIDHSFSGEINYWSLRIC